jgi:hypothetical protein
LAVDASCVKVLEVENFNGGFTRILEDYRYILKYSIAIINARRNMGVFDSHMMKCNLTSRQKKENQFEMHDSELWKSLGIIIFCLKYIYNLR